ncbi:MAG: GNAT family N-acetyltransferase [Sphaerobacter sp.]|nr:GNAT family N-acetyltransferase [Sphaerobacter sp.]
MKGTGAGVAVAFETFARHTFVLLEAARVYHQVWQDANRRYVDAVAILDRHAAFPGFYGLLARDTDTGQAVGIAYGHRTRRGQWWHDRVEPVLPPEHAAWLDDCFVIVELAVLPAHRRRGIGRALLAHLLHGRAEARAVISVQADNQPARALYAALGWQAIAGPMRFVPTGAPYVILGCTLR